MKQSLTIILGLLCALALAGCGGSGGGSSAQAVGGTLVDQNGAPLAGYRVVFNNNPAFAVTTDARGKFIANIPASSNTNANTEYVYDPVGDLAGVYPVPVTNNGLSVFRVTLPAQGPPPAPSGL